MNTVIIGRRPQTLEPETTNPTADRCVHLKVGGEGGP